MRLEFAARNPSLGRLIVFAQSPANFSVWTDAAAAVAASRIIELRHAVRPSVLRRLASVFSSKYEQSIVISLRESCNGKFCVLFGRVSD